MQIEDKKTKKFRDVNAQDMIDWEKSKIKESRKMIKYWEKIKLKEKKNKKPFTQE